MGFYLFIVFVDLKSHTRCLPVTPRIQQIGKFEKMWYLLSTFSELCRILKYLCIQNTFWNYFLWIEKFLSNPCSWVLSKQIGNQSVLLTLRWLADLFQYKGWSSKTCKSSIITSKDTNLLVKKETSIRISGKIIDHAHICYFYLPNPK